MDSAKNDSILTACAVLFNADCNLLAVHLDDGYSLVKKSLLPSVDCMEELLNAPYEDLRREYTSAILDEKTQSVICIYKMKHITIKNETAFFTTEVEEEFQLLDKQVRTLRLAAELPLWYKEAFFRQTTTAQVRYSESTRICPYEKVKSAAKEACKIDEHMISDINALLKQEPLPIKEPFYQYCHQFYDQSYMQTEPLALVSLMTALEMIFLDTQDSKKMPLAKRCAVYLYDTKDERIECYRDLQKAYEIRSNIVHEGNWSGNTKAQSAAAESDIVEENKILINVRRIVRAALIKVLNETCMNKKERIATLKGKVQALDYWEQ